MSEQTLFHIRNQERQFITQAIECWKPDHDLAMSVRDLEDLLEACLLDRDKDHGMIRFILDRSQTLGPDRLDQVNLLIQECCDDALRTLNSLSECVRVAESMGFPAGHAGTIAKAAEDYCRWKEDIPELLLLNHGLVQEQLRERIMSAINSPAPQSDWRDLFLEDAR